MGGKQTKKRITRRPPAIRPVGLPPSAGTAEVLNDLLATLHWQEQLVLYLLSRTRKKNGAKPNSPRTENRHSRPAAVRQS